MRESYFERLDLTEAKDRETLRLLLGGRMDIMLQEGECDPALLSCTEERLGALIRQETLLALSSLTGRPHREYIEVSSSDISKEDLAYLRRNVGSHLLKCPACMFDAVRELCEIDGDLSLLEAGHIAGYRSALVMRLGGRAAAAGIAGELRELVVLMPSLPCSRIEILHLMAVRGRDGALEVIEEEYGEIIHLGANREIELNVPVMVRKEIEEHVATCMCCSAIDDLERKIAKALESRSVAEQVLETQAEPEIPP